MLCVFDTHFRVSLGHLSFRLVVPKYVVVCGKKGAVIFGCVEAARLVV